MKILLTHAYSKDNKGDAAIVSVLLQQLNNAFSSSDITVSIYDDDAKYKDFEGYKVISNSMYHSIFRFQNVFIKLIYTIYVEMSLLFWAMLHRLFDISITFILPKSIHIIANEYLESDLFVPVGGGYLRAKKGIQETINILLLLNPIIVGILLGKPIILYTQSIGPFATIFQRWIVRVILNKTQLIFAREDHTVVTLKEIGVKANLVFRTTDAGFLFESDNEIQHLDFVGKSDKSSPKTLVGITVRKWLNQENQDKFEKEIAFFIDLILEKRNIDILLIPQVTSKVHHDDDRDVANRIFSQVKNKKCVINCTDEYDHYELKKLYGYLDFIIGTRFHSIIFSLTSYVPALAIEYEYKTSGIMKDLGLSEWVIPIEQVTANNLYHKFVQLMKEEDLYKAKLQKILPDYILKAKETEKQMQDTYHYFRLRQYTESRYKKRLVTSTDIR